MHIEAKLKNDINIEKNRYKTFGSFFTLFINCNPRCSAPKMFGRSFDSFFNPCALSLLHLGKSIPVG